MCMFCSVIISIPEHIPGIQLLFPVPRGVGDVVTVREEGSWAQYIVKGGGKWCLLYS